MLVGARFKDLCLDARDHQSLADWWCDAMGYVRHLEPGEQRPPEKSVPIVDPTGRGPLIWVIPVPEDKIVKNRMHIDVWGDAGELIARGASMVRRRGTIVGGMCSPTPRATSSASSRRGRERACQASAASNRWRIHVSSSSGTRSASWPPASWASTTCAHP